jgi:hypothetical protein
MIRIKLFSFSSAKNSGSLLDLALGERPDPVTKVIGFRSGSKIPTRKNPPRIWALNLFNVREDKEE